MEKTNPRKDIPERGWAKPFFTIWTGQAISLLGSQMVQFGLIWWLTKTTGSATVLATATMAGMLPGVVLGPFVGALVDRWNRRKIMLYADSGIALVTLVLAFFFYRGWAAVWMVYLALFLRALGGGFQSPAMASSTSLMVPNQHLTRVQGLNSSLSNGLNIVSAPLGALLLEAVNVEGVLLTDVISALFAIIPLLFIAIPQPSAAGLSHKESLVSSVWEDFKEGLGYVRRWKGLVILLVLSLFLNMIVGPAFALQPLLVREFFKGGALQLGWFESAFGIGAVIGGLLLGIWGGFKKKIHTSLMGLIGLSLGLGVIGFASPTMMVFAIGGNFIVGVTISLVNGPVNAILQATVDPAMQGRVFSLVVSLATLMSPLGLMLAGPLSDMISIQFWFILGCSLTLIFGVGGFFIQSLQNLEEQEGAQGLA